MRKHRDLIDQEAATIDIVESKNWRDQHLAEIRLWRTERAHDLEQKERNLLSSQVRESVDWLGASEQQEDIYADILRAYESTDQHWIASHETSISWLSKTQDCPVVWLNGKPGAGKRAVGHFFFGFTCPTKAY